MFDQAKPFEPALGDEIVEAVTFGSSKSSSFWSTVSRRLLRDKVSLLCAVILLIVAVCAIFAPWIAPADPYQTDVIRRLAPIGTEGMPLGGDELGRDMLSRMIWGGRVSLIVGLVPVIFATIIGGFAGIVAGYAGGWKNMAIMRLMDIFYAFPSVLLAVAIAGSLGNGLHNILISLTLILIPPITRVSESITTQVRSYDFVDAARATGASTAVIIRKHVLGNVLGPILVYASSLVSFSIIVASGLNFLGLGVSPPTADWGLMLSTLRDSIWIDPVIAALPGIMIFVTSLCFNLLSDGLRTAMDIRQ